MLAIPAWSRFSDGPLPLEPTQPIEDGGAERLPNSFPQAAATQLTVAKCHSPAEYARTVARTDKHGAPFSKE